MRATGRIPGDSGQLMPQAPEAPRDKPPGGNPAPPAKVRRARRVQRAKAKFAVTWAGDLWARLGAVDFMTTWFLLAGRVAWRRLVPCAVATGLYWIGMLVVVHFTFSGMVISSDQEYGPIGVVFDLMSFFIAIGVVIILGATTGTMWRDRGLSFRAAARKLRRAA